VGARNGELAPAQSHARVVVVIPPHYTRWEQARRCLQAPREFGRWHAVGDVGRTLCGYLIPTAVPTQTTQTPPPWRRICLHCRRRTRAGATGQLPLFETPPPTEETP
jgi:hypothetical protein